MRGFCELTDSQRPISTERRAAPPIKGNALRVYLFVLKNAPCELRDVQHALNLSTPSLAFYHLSKLVESGYLKRTDDGRYATAVDVSADLLDGYVKFGRQIVPQLLIVTIIFTAILAYYVYLVWRLPLDTDDIVTIVYSLSIIVLWFETIKAWRKMAG